MTAATLKSAIAQNVSVAVALLSETFDEWRKDNAARLGAALSYYALFAIGPLLVVLIAIAGFVWGAEAVRGEVSGELRSLLGDRGAGAVEAMLAAADKPEQGVFAIVVGVATLLFGAIGAVTQLKDALNTIWNVEPVKKKGWWPFLRTYIVSSAALLGLAFLLLTSLTLTAAISAAGKYFLTDIDAIALHIVNFAVSFAVVTALFAMMFKWLPDTTIPWRDVWIGAIVTAALFNIGKLAIGAYLGNQAFDSTYGAAASLIILLVWVYYSAQIVFLGAEFTQVYSRRRNPDATP